MYIGFFFSTSRKETQGTFWADGNCQVEFSTTWRCVGWRSTENTI